jgi:hypothetical protein
MEELKALEELTKPDIRQSFFVGIDASGEEVKPSIESLYERVSAIKLNSEVPAAIQSHFAQAKNLAVYSWYHYPFNVTAQFLALVSVEFALKKRLGKERIGLGKLISTAVEQGLLQDSGFSVSKNGRKSQKRYVETLVEVLPALRNSLAHGSSTLHNHGVSSLVTCAELINQLFPCQQASNPSIERTSPGKPGAASHVKR